MINKDEVPNWVLKLDIEDIAFMRKFIIASGSLKEMADQYNVSYPTIRARLNELIEKLKIEESPDDAFIRKIKSMVLDDRLDFDTAKEILSAYRKEEK